MEGVRMLKIPTVSLAFGSSLGEEVLIMEFLYVKP